MPQDSTPENLPVETTWEDDENANTLFLRSLFALVAGAFLLWAQWRAPAFWENSSVAANWGRWVASSVVSNFVLPLGIVWFFFAQSLRHHDWLKNQKHNAWNYGWNFQNWKFHLKIAGACVLVALPFLWFFSRDPALREAYVFLLPPKNSPRELVFLVSTLVLYMFCWEWFFRGFLLFGLAQGFGAVPAIGIQAILFGLSHFGKPPIEVAGAFAGGLILGALCWREKSFFPAFLIHAAIHVAWAVLI